MKRFSTIFILLILSGCQYYNYGVPRNDPQLIHPDGYQLADQDKYEFQSTICNSPKIEIIHLKHQHGDDSVFSSTIRIMSFMSDSNVIVQSVLLEHRDSNNKLIKHKILDWPNLPIVSPSIKIPHFIKTYDKADLPETIIEIVRIELKINGETKIIQYRFPLAYKKNYNYWDVMMSV